jgi:hypothetical protein
VSQPLVYCVALSLRDTNDELADGMRGMRAARASGVTNVICTVSGLEDDPRELWQIPEARAFCRRLIDTGFVSYLDPLAALNPDPATHYLLRAGFGAGEIWLTAEGRDLSQPVTLTPPMIEDLFNMIRRANAAADALIGE